MSAINRAVPHNLFRRRPGRTSAWPTRRYMDSLTPHKLFRRAFLDEHGLRFPEGRRRLEDHLFVVTALPAGGATSRSTPTTPCYYHIRRDDARERGVPRGGLGGLLRQPARGPGRGRRAHRAGPAARPHLPPLAADGDGQAALRAEPAQRPDPDAAEPVHGAAHRTAAAYFGPGVAELLPLRTRAAGRALVAGDLDRLLELAREEVRWQGRAELLDATWSGDDLVVHGRAALGVPGEDGELDAGPTATTALLGEVAPEELHRALAAAKLALYALERTSQERWDLPVTSRADGLRWELEATLDLTRAEAGQPLGPGRWDLYVELTALGIRRRVRLELPSRWSGDDAAVGRPARLGDQPVALYYTQGRRGLTVAVGRQHEPPEWKRAAAAARDAAAAARTAAAAPAETAPSSTPVPAPAAGEPAPTGPGLGRRVARRARALVARTTGQGRGRS